MENLYYKDIKKDIVIRIDIKMQRIRRRLTISNLSELSGVPKSTISGIENNRDIIPNCLTMYKIARALGCSIEDLIELE